MLFICKKNTIQCKHLAYFLNVLPDTPSILNSLLVADVLLSVD